MRQQEDERFVPSGLRRIPQGLTERKKEEERERDKEREGERVDYEFYDGVAIKIAPATRRDAFS